ncbi:MAG: hypothetical protein KA716_32475 [Gloeotrichia echinulata DEX184]
MPTLGKDAFDFPVFEPPFECFGADSQSGSSDSWRYIVNRHGLRKVTYPIISEYVGICLLCLGKLRPINYSQNLPQPQTYPKL